MPKNEYSKAIEMLQNQSEDKYRRINTIEHGLVRINTSIGYRTDGGKTGNGVLGEIENLKKNQEKIVAKQESNQEENRKKLKKLEKIVWTTTGMIAALVGITSLIPHIRSLFNF